MKKNKFSILMPTYNDSDTIIESLDSIKNQEYKNWELIIINDGSSDETEQVIKNYIKENDLKDKIKYLYQENADQLNALKNGLTHVSGDICYVFHSDDLLADDHTLDYINEVFNNNPQSDGCISHSIIQIDKESNFTKDIFYRKYTNKTSDIPLQLLNIGSNLYFDFPFLKTEVFKTKYFYNYLTWNRPFWCCIENNEVLNLKLIDKPYLKYRVYDNNYLSNPMGMINVFSGEFRTAMDIADKYSVPFYKLQYFNYRVFKKLRIANCFPFIYRKKPTLNKYKLVNYLISNRFNKKDISKFQILKSLLGFYKSKTTKELDLTGFNLSNEIYLGSDLRLFNKKMVRSELSDFYNYFLKEAETGIYSVILKETQVDDFKTITHFLGFKNIEIKIINTKENK